MGRRTGGVGLLQVGFGEQVRGGGGVPQHGREQVTGFHMMGELLGLDAIGSGRHGCDAMALEDREICEIPFGMLEQLSREIPALQQHFHRIMSREIARDYGVNV